ncbi:hypothetical protein EP227_01210 [bacterium]|nr:MAG: hypothetical protein EP227_01210 [bacterium]
MTSEELKNYCDGEFNNVSRVVEEVFSLYRSEKNDYTLAEKAAISAFLVNIYSGFENILKQMLLFDKLDVSDSPSWHEKVLKKASEIGILTPDLLQIFSKHLAFRNYFIYTYIFNIRWDETKVLVEALRDVLKNFRKEVDEYIQMI